MAWFTRLTQQRLAATIGMHRSTLLDYLNRYGFDWRGVKQR